MRPRKGITAEAIVNALERELRRYKADAENKVLPYEWKQLARYRADYTETILNAFAEQDTVRMEAARNVV